MKYKFVDVSEATSFLAPRDLTPEEEADIITQYKAGLDPAALEAECRELLEMRAQGMLVSLDDLMREMGMTDPEAAEKPA